MRTAQQLEPRHGHTPLTVLSGSPGAGTSTLMRHLMESTSGRRLVAVVPALAPLLESDAGTASRDGACAKWPGGAMAIETDDATATLAVLARTANRPEHVIVEAAAATNTRRVSGYAYMPGFDPDCTVTVVDATAAAFQTSPPGLDFASLTQLQRSDVIVLNKVDVAGPEASRRTQQVLSSIAPNARFIWSQHGRIAPSLLLGPIGDARTDDPAVTAEWRHDLVLSEKRPGMLGDACRTWRLERDEPIPRRDFRRWVTQLSTSILRACGTVHMAEDPAHRHEFMLVGSRWRLDRGHPWAGVRPATNVTLVGIAAKASAQADPRSAMTRDRTFPAHSMMVM